jgi:hypothetical protein
LRKKVGQKCWWNRPLENSLLSCTLS